MNPASSMSRGRFKNLQKLLQTICIRRTRELLNLPEPITSTRRLQLTSEERAEYQDLLQQCRKRFDMAVSGHAKGKLSSSIFLEALHELRLFCNNGRKQSNSVAAGLPADKDEALSLLQQHDRNVCAYCSGIIYSINVSKDADGGMFISSSCSHLVCRSCLPGHTTKRGVCKFCEAGDQAIAFGPISDTEQQPQQQESSWIVNEALRPLLQYPSKLRAFLSDIKENLNHKRYLS
jgi:SWI/SNF-related matrix-associated actin-dependent regulator of chromatin subfamily A3